MKHDMRPAVVGAFPLLGGRPCLNLIATLGRRHADPVERLPDVHALARWLAAAELLPDGTEPGLLAVSPDQLRAARELREAANRLVRTGLTRQPTDSTSHGGGYGQADIMLVNELATWPDPVPQLGPPGDAGHQLRWAAQQPVEAALSAVARDTVLLLAGPQTLRVKECAHPDCSLLFLDDSQAGRRRWCSMDRCGNLSKVTTYRSRRQTSEGHR
jgi:predicted RNA-binding Zn ribbon-like protein